MLLYFFSQMRPEMYLFFIGIYEKMWLLISLQELNSAFQIDVLNFE